MNIDIAPLAVFVLVTTFTPGPGNIASASMGMMYGYRSTLRFLFGMVIGYLVIMLFCAFLSSTLLRITPAIEPVLRLAGAGYILWLAVCTARATYDFTSINKSPVHFKHGFLLQALNPKAIVFGLTIYTTFLAGISGRPFILALSTFVLAVVTFCSVSLWAFSGDQIQGFIHHEHIRRFANLILVTLLVYCAVNLSGLFSAIV